MNRSAAQHATLAGCLHAQYHNAVSAIIPLG